MATIRTGIIASVMSTAILLSSVATAAPNAFAADKSTTTSNGKAKNVIFMLSDGNSIGGTTLTRWYDIVKKNDPNYRLALDDPSFDLALQRTYCTNSIITDSAPAGTAYSAGYKSADKFISVMPDEVKMPGLPPVNEADKYKPLVTVLEGAKLKGKATGIVSTSNVQHASPAAISAHWYARSNYEEIAEQQVYQDIDVVFGAGSRYLSNRKDGENLLDVLTSRGYVYADTPASMAAASGNKIWGMFADTAMTRDIDRDPAKQPSLAEMTKQAIDTLKKDKDGFFLFVEGSEVDWSAHSNDPVGLISDINAFDQAVKTALDFAKQDGNTLLIVTTDHGNGGITIGSKETDDTYSKLPIDKVVQPLLKAIKSADFIAQQLPKDASDEQIKAQLQTYWGITDVTPEELAEAKRWLAKEGDRDYGLGRIISSRANLGWTTHGHTGEDVLVYSYGPNKLSGLIENTDTAKAMAQAMGINLQELNNTLYVNAEAAFKQLGATYRIDNTDAANPVVVVEKGTAKAELPLSKDIIKINGKETSLTGLVIRGKEDRPVFVPQEAIDLFKKALTGK
ncbi:alkaline phosphatase [Heliobacterium mobile]|nr:alkaline phosphatase [Heliobacterium mobile]